MGFEGSEKPGKGSIGKVIELSENRWQATEGPHEAGELILLFSVNQSK